MNFDNPKKTYYHPKTEVRPATMQALEGLRDFYRITLPMPFLLDHVYCYAAEEKDGWVVIDTGLGGDYGDYLWRNYKNEFFGDKPVKKLIITHFHPDHAGAAGWFAETYDPEIYMPPIEYQHAQIFLNLLMRTSFTMGSQYQKRIGVSAERLASIAEHYTYLASFFHPFPDAFYPLYDGDVLEIAGDKWHAMMLCGHSPEQMILHNKKRNFALVADQAIAKISPNVGLMPFELRVDRFDDWFNSLEIMRGLDGVTMLSGHRKIFDYSDDYHDWVMRDHNRKFDLIRETCETPQYLTPILEAMFRRKLTDNDMFFAYGEGMAHVNHMLTKGELSESTDSQGLSQFVRQ